jgi:energy-coupling factor transporter ATP-binding protein EcfA2
LKDQVKELCRQLKPVLGKKIDKLWKCYLAESDMKGKADIEQTLELLAAKHLKKDYQPDRSPFPPPEKQFAISGNICLGWINYGGKNLYPFGLKSNRLKEHILIAGRSGSGKTNLTFILMEGLMKNGIKVLALDWKRSYRNLMKLRKDMRVYTVGRNVAPFRFNPLIPPEGCEPREWIKLIVDVIGSAYLGGEGVISLLVRGLDWLFRKFGVFDNQQKRWPTIQDLLAWLQTTKFTGRAAQWKSSAERILIMMCYGEFGEVINTQSSRHIAQLLDHDVVLEMDGLSSKSDRTMFSEALTLYLFRYCLAKGEQKKLTNMLILEEAHNLLLKKSSDSTESVLETSIRMVREYGLGFVFIDQMPHNLSEVAFANNYAMIALSQKLKSDVQAVSGAMKLKDEQKEALNTLPIGTAIVCLSDEFPEPFLVKVPLSSVKEGSISDIKVNEQYICFHGNSSRNNREWPQQEEIPAVPAGDNKKNEKQEIIPINKYEKSHPPSPIEGNIEERNISPDIEPPSKMMSIEAKHFLHDIISQPLSTTVSRYHRLHLSRRRGNAVRSFLLDNKFIEPVHIATRTGQVVLYQLTDIGRLSSSHLGLSPAPMQRESLEHRYWVEQTAKYYEKQGYMITREYAVDGNGQIDLFAEKDSEKIAIEVETGKSNTLANFKNAFKAKIDKLVFVATNSQAAMICKTASEKDASGQVEILTWLDIS